MTLLFAALAAFLVGGILAWALSRWPRAASAVGAGAAVAGCASGATFAIGALAGGRGLGLSASHAWHVPAGGIALATDPLTAFFLVPLFVLGAAAAVYGRDYLLPHATHHGLGIPWLAYNLLLASMTVVLTARHGLLFLVAWELMTLASYVLVVFEHEQADVRRAGWVYLIAAHIGTAFLIAMFLLLDPSGRSLFFDAPITTLGPTRHSIVLVLALLGFGVKAGIVPLHIWLPEAHAAAPSHVSALMSGVLTKMGIYGILRMAIVTGPAPAWWGHVLLGLGLIGAVFGIALATYQRDMKRALAYSTIENVGVVIFGLGLGFWGSRSGHPIVATLGLVGGLLHAWNHTAMKGLLFFGAGAFVHGAGTKDIEKLGGLMRRMPRSSVLFVVGSIAIAGLPPLNGFASEWLLYRAMLDGAASAGAGTAIRFMFALGGLSIVGALAALVFVRLCSTSLLGEPRSESAARAHDASVGMWLPMSVLAVVCLVVGARPGLLLQPMTRVGRTLVPLDDAAVASLQGSVAPIGSFALAIWAATIVVAFAAMIAVRRGTQTTESTWGCGYAAPTSRMQYTGRSFSHTIEHLLPRSIRARVTIRRPAGLFPASGELSTRTEDPVTRSIYEPLFQKIGNRFATVRILQQGALHLYLLYILVAVVAGLGWSSIENWMAQ